MVTCVSRIFRSPTLLTIKGFWHQVDIDWSEKNDRSNRNGTIRNVLQKRSISIQEIFHEQDNECKVLVLRIASLEKELHTFDPGHDGIHHHDATHRSHYLHKMRGSFASKV